MCEHTHTHTEKKETPPTGLHECLVINWAEKMPNAEPHAVQMIYFSDLFQLKLNVSVFCI